MGKVIGKKISKSLSGKYNQKHLDHVKQSATDAYKTASERAIQKIAEATGDLIENKIADRITKALKSLPQINSETVNNETKTPKESNISLEEWQKIIDCLRLT